MMNDLKIGKRIKGNFFRFCKKCDKRFTPTGRGTRHCDECYELKYISVGRKKKKRSK